MRAIAAAIGAMSLAACASTADHAGQDERYRAAIAAAGAAVDLDDAAEAKAWLAAAGPGGFEQRRLSALLSPEFNAEAARGARPARLVASRDGARLAAPADDGAIVVYEAGALVQTHRLSSEGSAYGAAFSPDGAYIATTSRDGFVRLWDARDGAQIWSAKGGGHGLAAVAYSPRADRIAYASWIRDSRGVVGILAEFNARGGGELARWEFGVKPIVALAYSPDGSRLAAGTWDALVPLWSNDRKAAPMILDFNDSPNYSAIDDIAFSADSALIAAATRNGAPRVWNARTGERVAELRGARSAALSVAFSADGRYLFSGAEDGTIRRWRTADWRAESVLFAHDEPARAIVALPGGVVASAGDDGGIRLWPSAPAEMFAGAAEFVYATPIAPDGSVIAASAADGSVGLWRVSDGARTGALDGLDGSLNDAEFSADGLRLIGCNWQSVVRVWTIDSSAHVDMEGFEGGSNGCALSPDGRLAAAGSNRKALFLFDAETGALRRRIDLNNAATRVRFSPDGSVVAVGDDAGGLLLFDVQSERARTIDAHKGALHAVLFSDDGRWLATAGEDRRVVIRDAASGEALRELKGHRQRVWGLAFAGDDRLLSASADRTIRIWRISDGAQMGVMRGFDDGPYSLAFAPARDRLIVNVPGAPLRVVDGRAR